MDRHCAIVGELERIVDQIPHHLQHAHTVDIDRVWHLWINRDLKSHLGLHHFAAHALEQIVCVFELLADHHGSDGDHGLFALGNLENIRDQRVELPSARENDLECGHGICGDLHHGVHFAIGLQHLLREPNNANQRRAQLVRGRAENHILETQRVLELGIDHLELLNVRALLLLEPQIGQRSRHVGDQQLERAEHVCAENRCCCVVLQKDHTDRRALMHHWNRADRVRLDHGALVAVEALLDVWVDGKIKRLRQRDACKPERGLHERARTLVKVFKWNAGGLDRDQILGTFVRCHRLENEIPGAIVQEETQLGCAGVLHDRGCKLLLENGGIRLQRNHGRVVQHGHHIDRGLALKRARDRGHARMHCAVAVVADRPALDHCEAVVSRRALGLAVDLAAGVRREAIVDVVRLDLGAPELVQGCAEARRDVDVVMAGERRIENDQTTQCLCGDCAHMQHKDAGFLVSRGGVDQLHCIADVSAHQLGKSVNQMVFGEEIRLVHRMRVELAQLVLAPHKLGEHAHPILFGKHVVVHEHICGRVATPTAAAKGVAVTFAGTSTSTSAVCGVAAVETNARTTAAASSLGGSCRCA
eukprot:comp4488_c0_seq1/m.3120 comp4488_c0_seq1/g.3120  ORF comp4488_c0_seq1/g.3120 comp4488_c0_seq1/m.3120 type:complete len:589 (-) comp4488_c0_seq1:2230-3996(-)